MKSWTSWVAVIVLTGCPAKDDAARRGSAGEPAATPGAAAVTTTERAYRTKPMEGAKWGNVDVEVDLATKRAPPSWPIPRMVQGQCQGADHVPYEAFSASPDGGVNGAVVWLDDIHEGRPVQPAAATLDQNRCAFAPHVLALPASGTLTLKNSDPANHADRFELGGDGALDFMKTLPGGGTISVPIQDDWAGKVARITCPIHLWMYGYALFFAHPYFAVTRDGHARLEGVPPGTYHLSVWHEATTSTYDSAAKLAPPRTAREEVTVGETDVALRFVIADDGAIAKK